MRRPSPPKHLDKTAAKKWKEILPQLADLEQGTLDALAAYCSAWSRWTGAESKVQELGPVVKSPQGFPVQNPYLPIAAQAQRQLRQWSGELRLTPKSRSARKPTEETQDPIFKLIHRNAEREN